MQRAPRWRKVVKWGLLACAVGIVMLAGVSWKWWMGWRPPSGGSNLRVAVWTGVLCVESRLPRNFERGLGRFSIHAIHPNAGITPRWGQVPDWTNNWYGTKLDVPLWIPFALTLGPYLLLARADRLAAKRAKVGTCPSCGYSRAGLASDAKCPECGKVGAADATKA